MLYIVFINIFIDLHINIHIHGELKESVFCPMLAEPFHLKNR
jgi:hypothetical protein